MINAINNIYSTNNNADNSSNKNNSNKKNKQKKENSGLFKKKLLAELGQYRANRDVIAKTLK